MDFLLQYVTFGVLFGVLDGIWLGVIAKQFYHKEVGSLMRKKPDMKVAVVFYLLYVLGVVEFVLQPAMNNEYWPVLAMGTLFGLVTYGTYDLTNQATLKQWSKKVVVADMAWGAFATGVASLVTLAIASSVRL